MTPKKQPQTQAHASASRSANRPANHTINLNGREYILFAGLLDEAHRQGLVSVKTQLIQVPTKESPLAVVSAEVTTQKGTFHGLGDASPESVTERVAPHLIRMAETRAVARAFRFATNIAMTAFEELSDSSTSGEDRPQATASKSGCDKSVPQSAGKSHMSQEEYIQRLCELREVSTDLELEIVALYDRKSKYNDWPTREASVVIDKLKACPKKASVA